MYTFGVFDCCHNLPAAESKGLQVYECKASRNSFTYVFAAEVGETANVSDQMTEKLVARLDARLEANGFIVLDDDLKYFDPANIAKIEYRSSYSIKFLPKGQKEEEKKEEVKT